MRFRDGWAMRAVLPPLALVALVFGAVRPASATPYIHVSAYYQIIVDGDLPTGIVETFSGYGDQGRIDVIHDFTSDITETASLSGSATFTNTADTPYVGGFQIFQEYSAFNPGGPEIGISIDNASQRASFISEVTATVSGGGTYGDMHICDLPDSPTQWGYFSPFSCGVQAPDDDEDAIGITDLAPGASVEFTWSISVVDTFIGTDVAEPPDIAVLATGLLMFGLLRHRSRK